MRENIHIEFLTDTLERDRVRERERELGQMGDVSRQPTQLWQHVVFLLQQIYAPPAAVAAEQREARRADFELVPCNV